MWTDLRHPFPNNHPPPAMSNTANRRSYILGSYLLLAVWSGLSFGAVVSPLSCKTATLRLRSWPDDPCVDLKYFSGFGPSFYIILGSGRNELLLFGSAMIVLCERGRAQLPLMHHAGGFALEFLWAYIYIFYMYTYTYVFVLLTQKLAL